MELAEKHRDRLESLKDSVKRWHEYWQQNIIRFQQQKKFVYYSTISEDEKAALDDIGQPKIQCNIIEAFLSRICGEFSKQEPSMKVGSEVYTNDSSQMVDIVESHIRFAEDEARKNGVADEVLKDLAGGGYSALKIYTDYKNQKSFDQDIKWKRCYDPTLCGWDVLAQESDKSDGDCCFELFPKTEDEFKEMYPDVRIDNIQFGGATAGFRWAYSNNKQKILLLCDYYEKKKKKIKIVRLSDNRVVAKKDYDDFVEKWNQAGITELPPAIVEERMADDEVICRYRFIENQVLEYEETNYPGLPIVFVDCNSVMIQQSVEGATTQVTRSYGYNAIGAQKVANVALQSIANELQNSIQSKYMIAKEAIPPEYLQSYLDPQMPRLVVYKAFLDTEGTKPGDVPLPPPREIQRPPMPPEFLQTLQMSFQLMQNILGSFDASLGINNNQLSGIAIVEGATQSNNAAMPMIVGYMRALNRIAQLYLDMIPKYYVTPRTIPVMLADGKKGYIEINGKNGPKLEYGKGELNIKIEPGVNSEIQKNRAIQLMAQVGQAFPIFAQFMGQKGLNVIIDNMDMRNIETLKDLSKQFEQEMAQQQQMAAQMQQQAMQTNPQLINAKTQQQKVMIDAQQNQIENQLKASELSLTQQQADNDRLKILAEMQENERNNLVEMDKHETEKSRAAVDMAMKVADLSHRHTKEHHELIIKHDEHKMKGEVHKKAMREQSNEQRF
jgi:hypothetical protein